MSTLSMTFYVIIYILMLPFKLFMS